VVDIAQNLFSTRRGSIMVGVGAAVVAAIVLFAYLHAYRNSVHSSVTPATVLVAKNLIQKGTPGDVIGTTSQYQVASIPKGQLKAGALSDPAALKGRIALADLYPGQQLTAADFGFVAPGSLQSQITGDQRVINLSTDEQHGLIGLIGPGDHVDIFGGFNLAGVGGNQPVIKLLFPNVLVLRAPLAGGSGIITLRAPERQAAQIMYAADNGRLWFVLRPASGAKTVNPGIINAQSVLSAKPVR
jgi:Flp pilus assembly protein CpaB